MIKNDIVVVGSGHNGLVAGAYLAAAGKRVLVLERNAWFGGGVVTRELTLPGFRHDQHSMAHIFIQANPLLAADELKLKEKYGLRYVFPDPPMMSVFEDGSTLAIHRDRERTCAEIAKFSRKDADAYRRLSEQAAALVGLVIAMIGIHASVAMDAPALDGAASIGIGLVLCVTAIFLAYETTGLLIGEHAHPAIARSIRRIASEQSGVKQVNALFTVHVGPVQVVAMLNVGFVETLTAGEVERAVELMEQGIKSAHPEVEAVFVKPQSADVYRHALVGNPRSLSSEGTRSRS